MIVHDSASRDWLNANKHKLEILIPVTQFITVLSVELKYTATSHADMGPTIEYIVVVYAV